MSMAISGTESLQSGVPTAPTLVPVAPTSHGATAISNVQVELVKCDCCGLTEECTESYIAKVRERHQGKWICGLCAEAVKDEIYRSRRSNDMAIDTEEEALDRHMSFCSKFRSSSCPPPDPTVHLISAMKQLLRRSLQDSPSRRGETLMRSTPSSPRRVQDSEPRQLARSESCFSALAR